MIKVRLTFIDDSAGEKELKEMLEDIKKNYEIISESKIYKGRNGSKYSNIYLDIYKKDCARISRD